MEYLEGMKRLFSLFLGSLFFFSSLGAENKAYDQIVHEAIKEMMEQRSVPGAAVALYYDGQTHLYHYGVMNQKTKQRVSEETIFALGPLTKGFTATLLALEIEKGEMALDAPVIRYIPAEKFRDNLAMKRITLEELATHTSGLPRWPNVGARKLQNFSKGDLMDWLAKWRPSYPPGTEWKDSDMGYGVLGCAIVEAGGASYRRILHRQILFPLGMSSTYLQLPWYKQKVFARGYNRKGDPVSHWERRGWVEAVSLLSTSPDMACFLKANLDAKGIPKNLAGAMALTQKVRFEKGDIRQGLAWTMVEVEGVDLVVQEGHANGFSCGIALDPERRVGVVVLSNKSDASAGKVSQSIARSILHRE
ncbi:MAG: Beta-lactamase [Chlamydiae bacterium]|nr:Beta-lactamase [Chlamydiota bacterium]